MSIINSWRSIRIALAIAGLAVQQPRTPAAAILGTWRGTSTCVDKETDRSCHDEVVIYTVDSAATSRGPVRLSADKVVNGVRDNMGDFRLQYDSTSHAWSFELHTRIHSLWTFTPMGDSLVGTLLELPSRRVVRRVRARR